MPHAKKNPLFSEQRRRRILRAALLGDKPVKAIAADEGVSEVHARRLLWAAGMRTMYLTSEERHRVRFYRKLGTPDA